MDDLIRVTVTREDIPADAPENVKVYTVITGTTEDQRRVSFRVDGRFVAVVRIDGCDTLTLEPGEILAWDLEAGEGTSQ